MHNEARSVSNETIHEQAEKINEEIEANGGYYTHYGLFCEDTDERVAARLTSRGDLWLILDDEDPSVGSVVRKLNKRQLKDNGLYQADEEAPSRADVWERRGPGHADAEPHFVQVVRLDMGYPVGAKVIVDEDGTII